MEQTLLSGKFGCRIQGIDLSGIGDAELADLLVALERHALLWFPAQALDNRGLYEFSRRIGPLEESARKVCLSPDYSEVANLTNRRGPDGEPLGFPGSHTDYWHSDQEFRKDPATLGLLYCLEPAPIGGDTSFATTVVSHLDLPRDLLGTLRGLSATYVPAETHDNVATGEVEHPVVLRSPSSHTEMLYVSENTRHFLGLDRPDSERLKRQLLDAVLRPENIYTHRWQAGDLVLYDNAQLVHRREAFEGPRWLKGTKIFAPKSLFAVPSGATRAARHGAVSARAALRPLERTRSLERRVARAVAAGFAAYRSIPLETPRPETIRAGRAGGLPFDSLTTDVVRGCLPATHACYGNCFAARAAFEAGFDFGKRVANELSPDVLRADLAQLPDSQHHLRLGWNSDPSWSWTLSLRVCELVREADRLPMVLTKCFTRISDPQLARFVAAGAELRVSVSAFDTASQLAERLDLAERYRALGGVAVPVLLTAAFRDARLGAKQTAIARHLHERDFPAAENSLRFDRRSPVLALIDDEECGTVTETGDLWAGRLFPDLLAVPTLTCLPDGYAGLPSGELSRIDRELVGALWADVVPTHAEVMKGIPLAKPQLCGVPARWTGVEQLRAAGDA